ncbi:hypothetical protein JCM14469_40790 [Desulfatiferula olefinivorans]
MQCPVCGSDRNPKDTKCPTCGVEYAKWLGKVINRLNAKKDKVMKDSQAKKDPSQTRPSAPTRYREVIKQDE